MLGLIQHRSRISSELSRRIGYTNGLHSIFRFARIVTYLYRISPASVGSLRTTIIEREPVQGPKYADGVIDVARALGLIHKSGSNLTLSDRGYALYAVQQLDSSNEATRALLLHSVLESDGDATLNLLDILANALDSAPLGELLVERLIGILEVRETLARRQIRSKGARDMILQELADSKRRLSTAVDVVRKQNQSWSSYREDRKLTPEQRLKRFYSHTVNPRRGWLRDLGCIQEHGRNQYQVTTAGRRILAIIREAGCYSDTMIVLPFSGEISELLGVGGSEGTSDLFWRTIAVSFLGSGIPVKLSPEECFHHIERVYPHVKFHLFNEAAIESVHDALAGLLAMDGRYIERHLFNKLLKLTLAEFPDSLYHLRQRHGGSGYIAMKPGIR